MLYKDDSARTIAVHGLFRLLTGVSFDVGQEKPATLNFIGGIIHIFLCLGHVQRKVSMVEAVWRRWAVIIVNMICFNVVQPPLVAWPCVPPIRLVGWFDTVSSIVESLVV